MEQEASLDLVWGISSIARLIGRTDRQTQSMLAAGQLPARQIGQRWVAKRKALEQFFQDVAA